MTWPSYLSRELFHLGGKAITPVSLLGALATIVLAVALGRLAGRFTRRFFVARSAANAGTAYAAARIAQYTVVITGILIGFDTFGFSLGWLATFGTFLSVGVGFGLQQIVQNFVCGLIVLIERPVKKGDFIRVGDLSGTVDAIAMRATRVITDDGVAVFVPNSELVTGRLVNLSAPTTSYRIRVAVGAAHGTDPALVRGELLEVAARHKRVLREPAAAVLFRDFGESALLFELCVWLDDPHDESEVASELRFGIDAAFREAGIVIAVPQRHVHFKGTPPQGSAAAERAAPEEGAPGAVAPS